MEISQTAQNVLRVLTAVGSGERRAVDITRATGLNRTVVARMLATLLEEDYVRREGYEYHPGPALTRLTRAPGFSLVSRARAVLTEVSRATGETSIFSARVAPYPGPRAQAVGRAHPTRVEDEEGSRRPITRGAGPLAILAFEPESVRSQFNGPTAELALIRKRGWSEGRGELRAAVHGVAVPVLAGGQVLGSIALLVPEERGETLTGWLPELRAAAAALAG